MRRINFTSGNQFTEGIPISVIQAGNVYNLPNIYYSNSKYYIYAFSWSSNGGGWGEMFMNSVKIPCIVYYI